MVEVPAEMPVNVLEAPVEPIVATAGTLLLHVPPVVASLSVDEEPTQVIAAPKIEEGIPVTGTLVVAFAIQPDPGADAVTVYTPPIVVVIPAITGFSSGAVYPAGPCHK